MWENCLLKAILLSWMSDVLIVMGNIDSES